MTGHVKWISFTAVVLALAAWTSTVRAQEPRLSKRNLAPAQVADQRSHQTLKVANRPDADEQDEPDGDYDSTDTADSEPPTDEPSSDEYGQQDGKPGTDSPSTSTPGESTEVIKERYPDGSIKIEREVTQDPQGNYINHGSWKMWDQKGNALAQGEYSYGNRTGTWVRWYRSITEADLFQKPPYRQFPSTFISQATFEHGQLDGTWTIYDGHKHKVSQFEFADGKRHGNSTWWHANGKKMREIHYRDGQVDGQAIEWSPDGKVTSNDTYQEGRKLGQKTSNYPGGAKKSQGMYLFAKDVEQTPDDWWTAKMLVTTKAGKDEKHGAWISWHSNGQKQLEGTYDHDLQVGLFTWWHPNGQKALEGRFENGKQDGEWTWWYNSGQKSIHGEYAHGNPTGRWTWWKEDGRVAQSADLSHSEGVVIDTPKPLEPARMPQARKPQPGVKPQTAKPQPQPQPTRIR